MDFETILKVLVIMGGVVVIPVAAYAAIAATRAIWVKGIPQADTSLQDARAAELEQRVAELEERVDFAERLLARQQDAEQLPRS